MADDPLAAYLAGVRERSRTALTGTQSFGHGATMQASAADVPALLAVVEKVLALAHEGPIYIAGQAVWDWTLDPAAVREAISSELLGEGGAGA